MGPRAAVLVIGAGEYGRLYGVYAAAEQLGVRFDIAGDILPDPTAPGGLPLKKHATVALPLRDEKWTSPMFDFRGLQPFHDFPEGPDWWDTEHYKLVITQLSKMKMNFLGLHTYPYAKGKPTTGHDEPTVWVGTSDGLTPDGSVKPEAAYETSYANTMRGEWGYAPLNTSSYSWGTAALFETDCWAPPPTTVDVCPAPRTKEAAAAFFERTSTMLADAFAHGKTVGVQSCVGTETPLSKPEPPAPPVPKCHPARTRTCYQDTEARVFQHTVTISSSTLTQEWCAGACEQAGFKLAAVEYGVACFCDNSVPETAKPLPATKCDMKCSGDSSEDCGGTYTMLAYAFTCEPSPGPPKVRPVNHTTQDYYEAMFTRLKKKVPALDWYWVWTPEGWEWGKMHATSPIFTDAVDDLAAAMAAHDKVIPDVKMATNGWVVGPLPDRSIFDQKLPASWQAITSIDMNTGHAPVDPSYENVTKHNKWVIPWMEDDPDLSAPQLWVNRTLEHMEDAKKYGCNGLLGIHWRTRAVGPQIMAMGQKSWNPELKSKSFWLDWVTAQFGVNNTAASSAIAAIFEGVDSFLMPLVVGWSQGPGKMSPKNCAAGPDPKFRFVTQLEAVRSSVMGAANQDRFGYWLATFKYMEAIQLTSCAWGAYNKAKASKQGVLEAYKAMLQSASAMILQLQQTLSNVGELGTYMNIESHSLLSALNQDDLAKSLGKPVPADATLPKTYNGTARLIIPTVRSTAEKGQSFPLRALLLAKQHCTAVTITVRPLGSKSEAASSTFQMSRIAREVWSTSLPAPTDDFEYFATAKCGVEQPYFPAGAPTVMQSVVLH